MVEEILIAPASQLRGEEPEEILIATAEEMARPTGLAPAFEVFTQQEIEQTGIPPFVAAGLATFTELGPATATFFDELGAGGLSLVLERRGLGIPQAGTPPGRLLQRGAGFAGFVLGPIRGAEALLKTAGKVVGKAPGIRRLFLKTIDNAQKTEKARKIAKVARGTAVLGLAEFFVFPEGEVIGIASRAGQGSIGAGFGAIVSSVNLIPNRSVRMLANGTVFALPSTLQNRPAEETIANAGIGFWFGAFGITGRPFAKVEIVGLPPVRPRRRAFKRRIEPGEEVIITEAGALVPPRPTRRRPKVTARPPGPPRTAKELTRLGTTKGEAKEPFAISNQLIERHFTYVKESMGAPTTQAESAKILFSQGKAFHRPVNRKVFREESIEDINQLIEQKRRSPLWRLRTDRVAVVANQTLGEDPVVKLDELMDVELLNFREILRNDKVRPSFDGTNLPIREGTEGHSLTTGINFYDVTARPGFALMQKVGHGDPYLDKGLNNLNFLMASDRASLQNWWVGIRNSWLAAAGNDPKRAVNMGKAALDEITLERLAAEEGSNAVTTVLQWRRLSDQMLEHLNSSRSQYGQELIERVGQNYLTHVFDRTWIESGGGVNLPWTMRDNVVPKKMNFPFEKERTGDPNYTRNFWTATDAYMQTAIRSVTDQGVRRMNDFVDFASMMDKRQIRLEKKFPGVTKKFKSMKIDWGEMALQTKNYSEDVIGKPFKWDRKFESATQNLLDKTVNALVPEQHKIRINSLMSVSNAAITLAVFEQLAGRPKPVLRNFGQHVLIIGQTGTRALVDALKLRFHDPVRFKEILETSNFIPTRGRLVIPEAEAFARGQLRQPLEPTLPGVIKKTGETLAIVTEFGMRPFMFVDRINVEDAYVAGFFRAERDGLSLEEKIKFGDSVAGKTQFPYVAENRTGLARGRVGGFPISKLVGRPLSLFTTWPANYMENVISVAKRRNYQDIAEVIAATLALTAGLKMFDIRGEEYTGITSPFGLLQNVSGRLPMLGIIQRGDVEPLFMKEFLEYAEGNDTLKEYIFYTDAVPKQQDKLEDRLFGER